MFAWDESQIDTSFYSNRCSRNATHRCEGLFSQSLGVVWGDRRRGGSTKVWGWFFGGGATVFLGNTGCFVFAQGGTAPAHLTTRLKCLPTHGLSVPHRLVRAQHMCTGNSPAQYKRVQYSSTVQTCVVCCGACAGLGLLGCCATEQPPGTSPDSAAAAAAVVVRPGGRCRATQQQQNQQQQQTQEEEEQQRRVVGVTADTSSSTSSSTAGMAGGGGSARWWPGLGCLLKFCVRRCLWVRMSCLSRWCLWHCSRTCRECWMPLMRLSGLCVARLGCESD